MADEALSSADALERRLATLSPGDDDVRLRWRMLCVRARALSMQTVRGAAMDAFRSAYAAFRPGDDGMLHEMLRLVSDLVAGGAPAQELVAVLSSDGTKSGMLAPLMVALRQHGGEEVRAPVEVQQVAADVRKRIAARAATQRQED